MRSGGNTMTRNTRKQSGQSNNDPSGISIVPSVTVSSPPAAPLAAAPPSPTAVSTPVSNNHTSSCGLCRHPDTMDMVACDKCGQWFHFKCVDVGDSISERDFCCEKCRTADESTPEFVVPVTRNGASTNLQPDQAERGTTLENQVEQLRRRLDDQLKDFERVLKEKDEDHRRTLARHRELFEQQLQAIQVSSQNMRAQLNPNIVTSASEMRSLVTAPVKSVTGAIPKASSTVINNIKSVSNAASQHCYRYDQQLKLLEERQALERKHLEEHIALQQRNERYEAEPQIEVAANDSSIRRWTEADVQQFLAQNSANELSRSQIAARQAVARELPVFYGHPDEWPLFIASFESSTRLCGYNDEENLLRLQRSLKGKALEVVRSRLLHPSNLAGVIATLRTLFGRPEIIVHSLVMKIKEMPSPKVEKLNSLIEFGVAVQNMCATIKACGLDDYMCNVALLQELVERLPPTIKLNWAIHSQTLKRVTLVNFGDWLGKLVEAACVVTISSIGSASKSERRNRRDDNFINVHYDEAATSSASDTQEAILYSKGQQRCVVCGGACNALSTCRRFLAMDISTRWSTLKENKLCRKCLQKHYGACQVKTPCGKYGCTFMHHQLLHDELRYRKREYRSATESSNQNCNTHIAAPANVLFRYVPVTIHGRGATVDTFAFLDDGSSATFMEHSLLKELNLEGKPHPLCLNWTGGQQRDEHESVKLSVKISGVHNTNKPYVISKVHTVKNLSLPRQSVSMAELTKRYEHLMGLPVKSYESVSPRILIGVDNARLSYPIKNHEGREDQPIAAKTRLGWVVYGPCVTVDGTDTVKYTAYHSFHIYACDIEVDNTLNVMLKEYFSLDSLGVYKAAKQLIPKEDERALEQLSLKNQLKGKRYETGLLWRFSEVQFPDSRPMAEKRLLCLEKRMSRDKDLAEALCQKIVEYKEKGYIKKLTASEIVSQHSRTWYLPIFPVVNPNKPGKLRIVWDAAAKVRGVSLNSFLLTGPDQLCSLLSIMYKFREFRFAVTGDIREMYHQVLINEDDQHSQRFLWRNGDSSRNPEVYVMRVMTFGATCSPSSAQFVKNLNAARFQERFPQAVECIVNEHYVDDMLTSAECEDELLKLARDVRYIHSTGGFQIRNWLSNSSKVSESLREIDVGEKCMNLCSEMATEKVLGMWWCTKSDIFTFRLSVKHDQDLLLGHKTPTKRAVLRTLMAIYDPLGLLANFLFYLKVLMQEVWRSGINWDDEIPENLMEKWRLWLKILPQVETVRVPRCYRFATTPSTTNNIQLHVFVDASENGIAAVAYWRFEQLGKVECALVGSKTRVSPLKFLSIPRLELQAAVVGARLAKTIEESHKLKPSERYFWTDSRDVICWINSDHRRYTQFVAFRVGEILETTEASHWRWLSTKLNVADEGTKWQKLPNFSSSNRWFQGPEFLWQDIAKWPLRSRNVGQTVEELRPNVLHHSIVSCCQSLIQWDRFSKWKCLVRTAAYVLRFVEICKCKIKRQSTSIGPLTQHELRCAELFIYRQIQHQCYPDEIEILSAPSIKSHAR